MSHTTQVYNICNVFRPFESLSFVSRSIPLERGPAPKSTTKPVFTSPPITIKRNGHKTAPLPHSPNGFSTPPAPPRIIPVPLCSSMSSTQPLRISTEILFETSAPVPAPVRTRASLFRYLQRSLRPAAPSRRRRRRSPSPRSRGSLSTRTPRWRR